LDEAAICYHKSVDSAFGRLSSICRWECTTSLIGREAQGIVRVDEYDKLCAELDQMLVALTAADGELLVKDVVRTAANAEEALGNPLPDLVVHWNDAALASELKIKGSRVETQGVSKKSTGQHASEGFCIYRGDSELDGFVDAKELSRLITGSQ
jgi:predicted AlkP superfamily phosphohydrolase/phosphomutase